MRTTGLGTWEKAGGHTFTAVTTVFLFSPTGAWAATQRLANTFELGSNPDELTGNTEANFFDTNGNLTSTVCATVASAVAWSECDERRRLSSAWRDGFAEAFQSRRRSRAAWMFRSITGSESRSAT